MCVLVSSVFVQFFSPTTHMSTCQNCHQEFSITSEDQIFYTKIQVPPPTFCPTCRLQRRMAFARNERVLYQRTCDACGKPTFSRYDVNTPFPVYDHTCWSSDSWDALQYGQELNFSQPFLTQWKNLANLVPQYATLNQNSVDCEYCSMVVDSKQCYLSVCNTSENSAYISGYKVRNSADIFFGIDIEGCYQATEIAHAYATRFARRVDNTSFSSFLQDCLDVHHSVGCIGLRHAKFYILNQEYSEEEYNKKIAELDLGSYAKLQQFSKQFQGFQLRLPKRFAYISNSENVSGDNIKNSTNCHYCFDTDLGVENCKFIFTGGLNLKDSYDVYDSGTHAELLYECECSGRGSSRILCSSSVWKSNNVAYSKDCFNCSDIFGCIGLRNKKYCILNTQYTKEEYEQLIPRIIQHMQDVPYIDKTGKEYRYGEFFPNELAFFAYNETVAQEWFPLSKQTAEEMGYVWKNTQHRNLKIDVRPEQLPDHISQVEDSIVGQVIQCEHVGKCHEQCTEGFKIIAFELEVYRNLQVPLPRLCPNCRHHERIQQKNPFQLWRRACQCDGFFSKGQTYKNTYSHTHGSTPCAQEFETSYAPDRPEIIYCGDCYQAEFVA